MSKKMFMLFLLCIPAFTKPLIGELMIGVAGAAMFKAAASPTGKAARWAATGYLLNTSAGKKFAALGFNKMRQILSNRCFVAQLDSGASRTGSVGLVRSSCNTLRSCGQGSIQLFQKLPLSLAAFRARVLALNFRNPFVTVTEFQSHTSAASSFGSTFAVNSSSFGGVKNRFGQAFAYRKASAAGQTTTFNAAHNHYTMHQAQGLFPRINHYYGDQGRFKFWKGFAAGSFASWTAAWYLSSNNGGQSKTI